MVRVVSFGLTLMSSHVVASGEKTLGYEVISGISHFCKSRYFCNDMTRKFCVEKLIVKCFDAVAHC